MPNTVIGSNGELGGNVIVSQDNKTNRDRILIGKIAGVYGIKGWVKVVSYTRPMENLQKYRQWLLGPMGKEQPFTVEACKQHGKGLIAKLKGLDDRDEASLLNQRDIAILREDLPKLQEGEYYWHDLLGLEVIDQDKRSLGKVKTILETGANDVFEVIHEQQNKKRLIPWVKDIYIKAIDIESQQILVDWQDDE